MRASGAGLLNGKFGGKLICELALALLAFNVQLPAEPGSNPQFATPEEYRIAASVANAQGPQQRLALLELWADKYPKSAFRQERGNETIKTYKVLGDGAAMLAVARNMYRDDPYGIGAYWIILLTISLQDTSPQALREGAAAAEFVITNSRVSFSKENCPRSVSLTSWYAERERHETLAHRTLGWVALRQNRFDAAEDEFTFVLADDPGDAEASFWLGCALIGRREIVVAPRALFHIARALSVTGPGALSSGARHLVDTYFRESYLKIHGTEAGMQALLQRAGLRAFPQAASQKTAKAGPLRSRTSR